MSMLESELTKKLLNSLNSIMNTKPNTYPGPNPISIERRHLTKLKFNKYWIGYKNDGERYSLCIIRYEDKPRCFLLNRKLEGFQVSLKIVKKLYNGTMIDCELVGNYLYIFDVMVYAGENISKYNFETRMSYIDSFLKGIKVTNDSIYKFKKKEFKLLNKENQLQYEEENDGYIFVPNDKEIVTGTNTDYFKLKPRLKNTIDFAIDITGKVYLQTNGKLIEQQHISIKEKTKSTQLVIKECSYVNENKWEELCIRHDKDIPNSVYTYNRTLINIAENLTINDIIF